ncbi:MAG TPA: hypothetical protein VJ505_15670 [Holophagaceae bacterium]|nr:hypothetical protein [Holophagaceae bacterium]
MRRCLLFPLLLIPALRAQDAMLQAHLAREAPAAPARLVLLEPPGNRLLQEGFRALLQSPALRSFGVPVEAFDLGTALGREQAATLRRGTQPQWLLVGPGGAVQAQGSGVPEAEAFAKALVAVGFQDRARALATYLKQVPDSLSAREQLIAELRRRGEHTAQRLLGLAIPTPQEHLARGDAEAWRRALGDPATGDLRGARTLSATEDLEAWGPFAQALDEAFQQGFWLEMDFSWTREGRPLDGASPTLRGLYLRWLPAVEAALPRQPESEPLWALWRWMQATTGGSRVRLLMARLVPSPLASPDQWPPEPAAQALRATARSVDDWRALQDLYRARWQALPVPEATPGQPLTLEPLWEQTLGPLLESALRAGDTGAADAVFQDALLLTRWSSLPARAAALAQRCGQLSLATRWGIARP